MKNNMHSENMNETSSELNTNLNNIEVEKNNPDKETMTLNTENADFSKNENVLKNQNVNTPTKKQNTTKKSGSTNKQKTPVSPITTKSLHELNLKVFNAHGEEIINENGNTIVGILMQEDGKIMTSFLGDYNYAILKTLRKVTNMYYKSLIKKLIKSSDTHTTTKLDEKDLDNTK